MSEPSKPAISGHPSIRKYGSTFSRFVNTILFGERGLRAGWRLMLFLSIFIASQYALDKTFVHWLLLQHVVSPITGGVLTPAAVLTEDGVAIIGLFTAMAILGKIEGKRLAAYGMPLAKSLLYKVSPLDPLSFGSVAAFLVITALVASLVPALRATRVDPVIALRAE